MPVVAWCIRLAARSYVEYQRGEDGKLHGTCLVYQMDVAGVLSLITSKSIY